MQKISDPIISLDYQDLKIPGVQVELDPDEANSLGAFEEDALSEADAWEANTDLDLGLKSNLENKEVQNGLH